MTNCTGAPAEQFLESYLLGKLPDSEALIFEEHYFECPVCLAQVEALQAIAGKLRTAPRVQTRAPIPWPIRFAAVGAIAAVLVAGFFVLRAGRIGGHRGAARGGLQSGHSDSAGWTGGTAPGGLSGVEGSFATGRPGAASLSVE